MYPSHSITILIIHAAASSFCLDLSSNMLRLRARSQSLAVKPAALRSTARPQGPSPVGSKRMEQNISRHPLTKKMKENTNPTTCIINNI